MQTRVIPRQAIWRALNGSSRACIWSRICESYKDAHRPTVPSISKERLRPVSGRGTERFVMQTSTLLI